MWSLFKGRAHGIDDLVTKCKLNLRIFNDRDTSVVEPWRAASFQTINYLVVDCFAFDHMFE
jgi:succinate dehydrogenase / fumarate reductase iron-sulfur subunit